MYNLAVLIVSACILATATAEFGKDDALFVCKEGQLTPSDKLVEKLKVCNTPESVGDKDTKCIAVCTTDAIGGLKDGIPDKDLFVNIVKTEFPEAEKAGAMERLNKCFEDRTFDKEDKTCKAIADFSICGTKLVVDTKC